MYCRLAFAFTLVLPACCFSAAATQPPSPVPNRAPLQQNAFNLLPLGAIEPRGWLKQQLQLQADGLTGHLGDFWKDVGDNSGWLGGTGESWERGPYYLDGLLPLAYQLGNQKLIAKARQWVDWTLDHQRGDGQIGPRSNDDWWPRMVMLKVLTQYQEVSADPRVIPVMTSYFRYELQQLPKQPLRDWGKYRWQDNVYSVLWLYNRTGDAWLLDLARLLHQQGYDWRAQFDHFTYTSKMNREILHLQPKGMPSEEAMQTHGVNNAMALKASPLWYLLSGDGGDRSALDRQLAELDRYHGLPNGMFSGDEHFAGPDPSQGIELCAVVETMFSLEQDLAALGEASLADRLEKISFNTLPATLSDDVWSHQYDQQPNQISCTLAHRQWSTNNDDSNMFGLEPNFGCCTANLHQGWPKFVSSLWMGTPDSGLAAVVYAPNRVKAGKVTIDEDTDYPFADSVRFTIHTAQPNKFPLVMRIPGSAQGGTLSLNGKSSPLPARPNHFYRLDRTWKDGDTVQLQFRTAVRVTHWYHNSIAFERGALVFALPLDVDWSEVKHYDEKSSDWQLTSHTDWNYAVALGGQCTPIVKTAPSADIPFDRKHPRVLLQVEGRQLPGWTVQQNSAGSLPVSPVNSHQRLQPLTLIPYGAAKLRVTAFPYLAGDNACRSNDLAQR